MAIPRVRLAEVLDRLLSSIFVEKSSVFIIFISFVCFSLIVAARGYDLTDDGFYYLAATLDPTRNIHNSPFALITSIVWTVSGSNIPLFRIGGIVILFLAAFIFTLNLNSSRRGGREGGKSRNYLFSGALAILITAGYYSLGLPGLSYNWGSLVGLLLIAAPLFSSYSLETSQSRLRRITLLLLPFGALLVLTSKWSSLLLFVFGVLLAGALTGRSRVIQRYLLSLFIATAFGTAMLLPWILPHDFLSLVSRGYSQILVLNPDYGLMQGASRFLMTAGAHLFVGGLAYAVISVGRWLTIRVILRDKGSYQAKAWPAVHAVTITLLTVAPLFGMAQYSGQLYWSTTSLFFAVIIALAVERIGLLRGRPGGGGKREKGGVVLTPSERAYEDFWFALVAVVMCLSHAFGSANGAFNLGMSAAVLFSVAIAIYAEKNPGRKAAALLAVVILTQSLFFDAIITPYRGENLLKQSQAIEIQGSRLLVDPQIANRLEFFRECANRNGWTAKTGLYDLTSWNPGFVFFLDAAVPSAVLSHIGGYSGSEQYTIMVAQREQGETDGIKFFDSWVLLQSDEISSPGDSHELYASVSQNLDPGPTKNLGHSRVCELDNWILLAPH